MKTILVTGSAGFIGHHVCQALLSRGDAVVGLDNFNSYYDPALKRLRQQRLETLAAQAVGAANSVFYEIDLADRAAVASVFERHRFDAVVHLGAQAGVRYSLENPHAYVDANLVGFVNVLEGCRHSGVGHLVYASSSSVYGMNHKHPFATDDRVDAPISLYAATKKANELMAHSYSHLFQLPCTGLRFFTVYGPYGRPDMAYFKFTQAVLAGRPIDVFNNGNMQRDFTYVDDVVQGVLRVLDQVPPVQTVAGSNAPAPYRVYNIGNHQPVTLRRFIQAIETAVGRKAVENHLPMQAGDVPLTYADVDDLMRDTGFCPDTPIEDGMARFVAWYRSAYTDEGVLRHA